MPSRAATTTTGDPVWAIHSREATEEFGVSNGRAAAQTKLFDLDGRVVAEYSGDKYQGDAGRVYYWFPDSPGAVARERSQLHSRS